VFAGLWLTVAPDDAMARAIQLASGAVAIAAVMVSARLAAVAVVMTTAATACAWLFGVTADPFVLTGLAVFRLAETRGGRRFPWWIFAGSVAVVVVSAIFGAEGLEDRLRAMMLSALVVSVAWVLGVRTREIRDEAAARSRTDERLRLARDVHDVLSHSLGAIGVRAGVAAHVSTLSAEELRQVLRDIEEASRSSLSDLKSLLRRERSSAESEEPTSSPLSAALLGITHAAENAGLAVRLHTGEGVDELPADVRTSVLRIVQEAVTNVIRHTSASAVDVALRVSSMQVAIDVEDDGSGSGGEIRPGHGLTGMRERVELLGGMMVVAASTAGVRVSATLPLPAPPRGGAR
jgi:signal transduction histidine kinase